LHCECAEQPNKASLVCNPAQIVDCLVPTRFQMYRSNASRQTKDRESFFDRSAFKNAKQRGVYSRLDVVLAEDCNAKRVEPFELALRRSGLVIHVRILD
jgi:hypothetical protein